MRDSCREAIEQAVSHAAASGEMLVLARVAKAIALQHGGSAQEIAEELTAAGINAGVTMQFGSPDGTD